MGIRCARRALWTGMFVVIALADAASAEVPEEDDLAGMDLEALVDLEVTTVSKRAQKVSETPAAVFVISQEDIRRSGATTVPDLLRMAPGVHVAQIDANRWAISARGFNDEYSNKLLVMIDGRSIYTPLFSGVIWNEQELMIEDIDRVGVVRGPGGAMWGANAVNGVIHIITKVAKDDRGSRLITQAAASVTDMVNQIAEATSAQTKGSEAIQTALQVFKDVTEESTLGAEAINTSVASLLERAAHLETEIGRFKTE